MEELEKLEYPKPHRDFIYDTFNAFADRHPWVGQENIRPKSIAREMFEEYRSFSDTVKYYELHRAEGLLLRYLSSVHKVLAQTVPDPAKNDTLREMEVYLRAMIRQVDSSLLDEWEKMRDPNRSGDAVRAGGAEELRPPGAEEAARDITRNPEGFLAAIRDRIFAFLRAFSIGDVEAALGAVPADFANGEPWTPERLRQARENYLESHTRLRLDPEARNRKHTHRVPAEDPTRWLVEQTLVDPDELNDWVAGFEADLPLSREAGEPVLRLVRIGPLI